MNKGKYALGLIFVLVGVIVNDVCFMMVFFTVASFFGKVLSFFLMLCGLFVISVGVILSYEAYYGITDGALERLNLLNEIEEDVGDMNEME